MSHTDTNLKTPSPIFLPPAYSSTEGNRALRSEVLRLFRQTLPPKVLSFMKKSCNEKVVERNWQIGEQLSTSLFKGFFSKLHFQARFLRQKILNHLTFESLFQDFHESLKNKKKVRMFFGFFVESTLCKLFSCFNNHNTVKTDFTACFCSISCISVILVRTPISIRLNFAKSFNKTQYSSSQIAHLDPPEETAHESRACNLQL